MKRIFTTFLFISLIAILAACGKDDAEPLGEVEELHPIEVELTVTEAVKVGESVEMTTLVTQNGEEIADADKVVYEIWEEGKKEESEMLDAVNEKDGTYTGETSFDADGMYHIQVHVDARAQHSMPTKTVTVGDGGEYEEETEEDGSHAHHTEGFSMHFVKPENVQAGEETEFVLQLELDDQALENARVRYEIWSGDNADNKDWITAEESAPGEYTAVHNFPEAGLFQIVIHVQDDEELHEHEEHEIEVQ